MNDKEPVVFKTEDSLWQMMAKGIKTWDARLNDVTDERILRLTRGHWEKNHPPGRLPYYAMDEEADASAGSAGKGLAYKDAYTHKLVSMTIPSGG